MDPLLWKRVEVVLDDALEQSPEELPAFLDRACGGDAQLRAALLDLLRADADAGQFLAAPAALSLEPLHGPVAVGQLLGGWRIERLLGEGGMGRVYLACRTRGEVAQRGALKVLTWSVSPEARERFLEEQRLLASLEHPGIARFIDAGVEGELPWFVMEYVDGTPLVKWSTGRPLPDRLHRFLEVCDAVSAAHGRLVVHRDIKPSNVLVTPQGTARLLDFGIARELDADRSLTRTEARVLSPEYAAPEQLQGGLVTTAIDVWGLGILLHELLTGEVPWPQRLRPGFTVHQAILAEDPPGVAARLRPLCGSARAGDLEGVIWKALQKVPARRYGSVEALAADVRRVLDGVPVTAREHTSTARALRFLRRHAGAVLAVAAIVAVTVAGAAATAWQAHEARLAAEQARAEAGRARAAQAFLVSLFTEVDPAVSRKADLTARELLERGSARIATELEGQPELQDALYRELAAVQLQLGQFKQGEAVARRLLALRERRGGPDDPRVAQALQLLADLIADDERLAEAEPVYARALAITERHGNTPVEVAVGAMRGLAAAAFQRGDAQASEVQLLAALDLARTRLGPRHEVVAEVLSSLTSQLIDRRLFERATPFAQEGLALSTALFGRDNPARLVHAFNWAFIETETGRMAQAALDLAELGPLLEAIQGPDHPSTLQSRRLQAKVLGKLGRGEEADAILAEVVRRIRAQAGGVETENLAYTLIQWDGLRRETGRPDGARAAEAERILVARFGQSHPDVGWAVSYRAADALDRGALDEAWALATRAEALQRPAPGSHDAWHADTLDLLGRIALRRGRRAEAEALYRRALSSFEALGSTDGPRWRVAWHLAEATSQPPARRLEALREPVEQLAALFPDGHPQRTGAVLAQVRALREAGRPGEASELLAAEEKRAGAWGQPHPLRAELDRLRRDGR